MDFLLLACLYLIDDDAPTVMRQFLHGFPCRKEGNNGLFHSLLSE